MTAWAKFRNFQVRDFKRLMKASRTIVSAEIMDYPTTPVEFKALYPSVYEAAYDEKNAPCDPAVGPAAFAWVFLLVWVGIDFDTFRI